VSKLPLPGGALTGREEQEVPHGQDPFGPRVGTRVPERDGPMQFLKAPLVTVAIVLAGIGVAGCATFVGNSFQGQDFNEVPDAAQDLAVAPDGQAMTGSTWMESAHDVRAWTASGTPYGPWPGSSAGRFRETGGGPLAVAATNTHFYAAQRMRIVRWDRSTFASDGPTDIYEGDTVTVRSGAGSLLGIAECGSFIYVVDPGTGTDAETTSPASAKIDAVSASMTGGVVRSWTAPHARQLTCDRQGNVWALEQGTGTDAPALARYSPDGSLLARFTLPGYPMDVAADPTADRLWVADNSRAQQVEAFSYAGTQTATLGQSYLSGPMPGLVGPGRFAGVRGVGVDGSGDVYVAETGAPGRGARGWTEMGKLLVLSKFSPSGSVLWRREGLVKGSVGEPSGDLQRFYLDAISGDTGGDGSWHYRGYTLDPWANPNDPRYANDLTFDDTTSSQVRDFGGRRYVFQQPAHAEGIDIYRVDGEILTPVGHIDAANLTIEGSTTARPGGLPDNCFARDYFVQGNGDIWKLCQDVGGVWRFRLTGFTSDGAPIYSWSAVDVYPMPSQISGGNAGRIDVEGGSVYVSGNGPGESSADPDPWLWMGRRIVKFPSLPTSSGWPAPAWNRTVFYNANSSSREKPVSYEVDGNLIAVGYQACNYSWGTGGCLRFYSATTGDQVGSTVFAPPQDGKVGWLDEFRPISFRGGQVYVEDDHLSKLWVAPAP
jgi:hypothetical protein